MVPILYLRWLYDALGGLLHCFGDLSLDGLLLLLHLFELLLPLRQLGVNVGLELDAVLLDRLHHSTAMDAVCSGHVDEDCVVLRHLLEVLLANLSQSLEIRMNELERDLLTLYVYQLSVSPYLAPLFSYSALLLSWFCHLSSPWSSS